MISERGEPYNNAFPGFYFGGAESKIYSRIIRTIVSICCFIICFLFFIPLFSLFRMQLASAIERRQMRKEEKEYQKNLIKERLDEEVWEDLEYEEEDDKLNEDNAILTQPMEMIYKEDNTK